MWSLAAAMGTMDTRKTEKAPPTEERVAEEGEKKSARPKASSTKTSSASSSNSSSNSSRASSTKTRKGANNVRKLRTERMISKAELARRAGLSTLTIDRVEKGMPCRMDTKRKILEALGLTPQDRVAVFGEED